MRFHWHIVFCHQLRCHEAFSFQYCHRWSCQCICMNQFCSYHWRLGTLLLLSGATRCVAGSPGRDVETTMVWNCINFCSEGACKNNQVNLNYSGSVNIDFSLSNIWYWYLDIDFDFDFDFWFCELVRYSESESCYRGFKKFLYIAHMYSSETSINFPEVAIQFTRMSGSQMNGFRTTR